MTERRWKWIDEDTGKPLCTVSVPNVSPEDRPQSEPCGALIVEGPCRFPGCEIKWSPHATHYPLDPLRRHVTEKVGHDGWECESGHPVAAEVVA